MINKLRSTGSRISNGWRFGINFLRRSGFQVPEKIKIDSEWLKISHPCDQGVTNDFITCFLNDEYGLRKAPPTVKTILDIGANIGFFSMAARDYFPTALIHAYEPNPRTIKYCQSNAEAAKFTLYSEALGSHPGTVYMVDESETNQARTINDPDVANGIAVTQIALREAIERLGGTVDLTKIYCEGAEWDLFQDPESWRHIHLVRMEYHLWGKRSYREVEQALANLDFTITWHQPSGEWGTVWAKNNATSSKSLW